MKLFEFRLEVKEETRDMSVKLFGSWFRRCRLKIIPIFSFGSHFVQQSKPVCAIMVEACIMRNIYAEIF